MQFKISRDSFFRALHRVQGIIEKRNTMPILSNILLEAFPGGISVTATDLEVGMKSTYPANVSSDGKITVGAKKLFEIVKELPSEEIIFSIKENDWVEIRCGKALFRIVGLSPEEFPFFPSVNDLSWIRINSTVLGNMVEKTSYAICHDETKYNLNGIFFKTSLLDENVLLQMVATDGHRLSIVQKKLDVASEGDCIGGVIFPKKGVFEIKRMAEEDEGDILIAFMDNNSVVKKGDTLVVMRLLDGDFPDYGRVIPPNNDKLVTLNRKDFLHSLRRMSILSSEKYKGVKLQLQESNLEISSSNPEIGEAKEDIEVSYTGISLTLRFNARYLMDVLSVIDENEVELLLKDDQSPVIIRPPGSNDFTSVIMPMRL